MINLEYSNFRNDIEWPTVWGVLDGALQGGTALDLTGKSVVDIGCGDGVYAGRAALLGAEKITCIDSDPDFVSLIESRFQKTDIPNYRLIECITASIQDVVGNHDHDVALGSYILSYPANVAELYAYVAGIASLLKPGGVFIGFNNNSFNTTSSDYGSFKRTVSGIYDGAPVLFDVPGMSDRIENYHINPAHVDAAFMKNNFMFSWIPLQISKTASIKQYRYILDNPPFIGMFAMYMGGGYAF